MKQLIAILAITLAMLYSPIMGQAQTLQTCSLSLPCSMQWDANLEPDMSVYRVYLSQVSGVYTVPYVTVSHPTVTTSLGVLTQGTYFLRVTAVDLSGNESLPSNELTFFYDGVPSNPTIRFSVSIP